MYSNSNYTKLSALMLASFMAVAANAQNDKSSKSSNSKEEGNRNVMLNAASANCPLPTSTYWRTVCLSLTPPVLIQSTPHGALMQAYRT